ncbi:hypothetical protein ACTOJ1_001307 [Shigella flexneri]
MSHDVAMLTRVFKDADTLVARIDQNHSLKNYFICGGCGQLAKLIYQNFLNKRKKNYKLLCFMDFELYGNPEIMRTCSDEDFLEEYGFAGIDHVALIIGDKIYDACGVEPYDKEKYSHRLFPKTTFCYKEIEIGNVSQSKQVFEKVLFGHLYGHKKQSEIISRIFHDLRLK